MNQMTSGTKGRETGSYFYDGIGRLVRSGNAAGETTYVTDRTMWVDLPLSSMKGGKTANHVYGAEGTAVIGYEGMLYTVTSDRLGSIRRITSPEGTEIAGFTYDAWGRPKKTVAEGYETSALGLANYTGHLYDDVLNLYYAKARMYSPEMKKFTALDPIKSGRNWTRYCLDNPLKFIDPDGEAAQEVSRWQKVKEKVGDAIDTAASGVWGGIAGVVNVTAKGIYSGETTAGKVFPSTQTYYSSINCSIAKSLFNRQLE